MTSHVIRGLTDGAEYTVRVIATTDDAESAPSGEVTATPRETTPPAPSSASVDGSTLTLTFDEPLDTGEVPDRSAFAVTVGDSGRGVAAVAVSGSAVTITLVTAVVAGDTVTVGYTAPTDDVTARLQDLVGNAAASFSGQSVTNDTQAAAQFTASAHDVPAAHDGGTTFTFELRFSEEPMEDFSYKTLRDSAFTVTSGDVTKARRLEKGRNVRWEIQRHPGRGRRGDRRAARHHGLRRPGSGLHRGPQAPVRPAGANCQRAWRSPGAPAELTGDGQAGNHRHGPGGRDAHGEQDGHIRP